MSSNKLAEEDEIKTEMREMIDDAATDVGGSNHKTNENIDRFLTIFERTARRWEMVVYPALFAFILLAGYGFYLIYSLTHDMRQIAASFDPTMGHHMEQFAQNLEEMSTSVNLMATSVAVMTADVKEMTTEVKAISGEMGYLATMDTIEQRMGLMTTSVDAMTNNLSSMRYDMSMLNNNVSRPMSFMNSFMPW